ncbi:stellacyanin [Ipomoea triloba]|uniref:stellacyanin n=1 Tax=Ipomoea triloba TaxID=35885 RepID=UPI00125E26E1|nr:stellacyanin [Ipomoea triloba]
MCSNFLPFYCSLLVLLAVTTPTIAAEEFQVGGAVGWRRPDLNHTQIYDQWASHRRFHVGDSIRFEYKNDTVVEVEKWAYYHCDTSRPISAVSSDGNTTVNLDKAGAFYFVSGDYEHCKDGQRLHLDVFPLHQDAIPKPPPHSNSDPIPLFPIKFFSLLLLTFNAAFLQ